MVTQCGMSTEFGPVYVSGDGRSSNGFGPETQRRVDNEISRILRDSYSRVQMLLVRPFQLSLSVRSCSWIYCKLHHAEICAAESRLEGAAEDAYGAKAAPVDLLPA